MTNTHDLQQLSVRELEAKLYDARAAYIAWREKIALAAEQDYARLPLLKRDVARIATVLRQKRTQAQQEELAKSD